MIKKTLTLTMFAIFVATILLTHTGYVLAEQPHNISAEEACYALLISETAKYTNDVASAPKHYADLEKRAETMKTQRDFLTTASIEGEPFIFKEFHLGTNFNATIYDFYPFSQESRLGSADEEEHEDNEPVSTTEMHMVYFDNQKTGRKLMYCYDAVYDVLKPNLTPQVISGKDIGIVLPPHEMSIATIEQGNTKYKQATVKSVLMDAQQKNPLLNRTEIYVIPPSSDADFNPYTITDAVKEAFDAWHNNFVPAVKKAMATSPTNFRTVQKNGIEVTYGPDRREFYGIRPILLNGEASSLNYSVLLNYFVTKAMVIAGQSAAAHLWLFFDPVATTPSATTGSLLDIHMKTKKLSDLDPAVTKHENLLLQRSNFFMQMAMTDEAMKGNVSPEKSVAAKTFWRLDQLKNKYTDAQTGKVDEQKYLTATSEYLSSSRSQQKFDTAPRVHTSTEPVLTEVAIKPGDSALSKLSSIGIIILILVGCCYGVWLFIRKK